MAIRLLSLLLLGFLVLAANSDPVEEYEPQIQHELFDDKLEEDDITSELVGREKRQIAGAGGDAMDRSLTRNPIGIPEFKGPSYYGGGFRDPKNFNAHVGGSVGAKVWERNSQSVGVGLGGRVNTGLSNGRPFANKPEVGVGLGYQNGRFSTSVGVGHGYQSPFQQRPSTSYGVRFGYRFKRSAAFDEQRDEDDTEELDYERQKRQIPAVGDAMDRSLTNNPVGKPEFHLSQMEGGGRSPNNFGGAFGGSAGTKVWERNGHSVGVGIGGSTVAGMSNGRPFHVQPQYGAGLGYQKGPYSVSVGAGRSYQNPIRPSNSYGVRFGYRFRRAALDEDQDDSQEEEVADQDSEQPESERQKRQIVFGKPTIYKELPRGLFGKQNHHQLRIGGGRTGSGFSHKFKRSILEQATDNDEYIQIGEEE